jgi:hypothetical protein
MSDTSWEVPAESVGSPEAALEEVLIEAERLTLTAVPLIRDLNGSYGRTPIHEDRRGRQLPGGLSHTAAQAQSAKKTRKAKEEGGRRTEKKEPTGSTEVQGRLST